MVSEPRPGKEGRMGIGWPERKGGEEEGDMCSRKDPVFMQILLLT